MSKDRLYMERAILLAKKGKGRVSTNPMVGAVIVYDGVIIGEGYHQKCGEAHAEVNAIASVSESDIDKIPYSTMYVSLEPCSHWGKTPPCCELIVKNKIGRVVIAMQDPFGEVCGRGIKMLKDNGVDVVVGLMEEEAMQLNKRFITYHSKQRPYIILKWASTIDGFIDTDRDISKPAPWITNYACKVLVHKYRVEEDAIWVGKNTVVRDNPALTVREWCGKNPIRISMDNSDNINQSHKIMDDEAETIIYNNKSIEQIIDDMYQRGIQSVLVEGGKMLLDYLIENKLFDEIREFVSPLSVSKIGDGSISGIMAPQIKNCTKAKTEKIGNVTLNTYFCVK